MAFSPRVSGAIALVAAACALAGCKRSREATCGGAGEVPTAVAVTPAPGALTDAPWLMGATRVAVLRRSDDVLIVAAGRDWLRLFDVRGVPHGEASTRGMAQALHVTDVDGDGVEDIVVGRGRGRGVMSAPPTVLVHRAGRVDLPPETIALPPTSRAQVTGIVSAPRQPGRVWITSFTSKYVVAVVEATRGGNGVWATRTLSSHRVVVSIATGDIERDGTTDLVAARPYGDSKEQPGFAFVVGPVPMRLPTVGGARAITTTDGGATVIVAEGWHFEYGRNARALVATYRKRSCGWDRRVLANVAGRHGYDRIQVADVQGDGVAAVVATGDGPGIYIPLSGGGGPRSFGQDVAYDAAVADLDGDRRPEVVLVGKRPGIWRLPRGS